MALVIDKNSIHNLERVVYGTHTFASAYVAGGEASDPTMNTIRMVQAEPTAGMQFHYDRTNKKIQAMIQGGGHTTNGVVVEEVVTVAANVGTLSRIPAYIIAVDVTAGSTTGAFDVIPVGDVPITTQVAVNFVTGGVTFVVGDAVTSVRVTYLPAIEGTMLAASNFTRDEAVVAAAATVNLAARAGAIQYVYDTTGNTLLTIIPVGEAPASGEVAIDINNSGDTSIDTNADIDGNSLLVSYLQFSAFPYADLFIDDTDITLSSEAWNFTTDQGIVSTVIGGFGTRVVGETGAAGNQLSSFAGPSIAAAATVVQWVPDDNRILTNESTAMVTTAMPFFKINASLISGGLQEVAPGTDLSGVVVKVKFEGE